MLNLGNRLDDQTVYVPWDSCKADGSAITATGGTIRVYEDATATERTDGITDTRDFDGKVGTHLVTIVTTDGFYSLGHDYTVMADGVTIDGKTVRKWLARFSIQNWYNDVNTKTVTTGAIGAGAIATDAIGADEIATTAVNEIRDAVVAALNNLSSSDVQTACNAALEALRLHRLLANAVDTDWNTTVAKDCVLAYMAERSSTRTYSRNSDSQEQIQVQLDNLATWLDTSGVKLNAQGKLDVNAQCDTALADYDGPTNTEMEARTLSSDATDRLETSVLTVVAGAATSGTLSTTQMSTDLSESTDDHYNGRVVFWTSGVLQNQARTITNYAGTNGVLTFEAATEAPSNGDTFIIV